jgi:hypothetical protein
MYIVVASHSIFGFVAMMISQNFSFLILVNSSLNLRSLANTQLIGEIEPPRI